jgi:hypothetical protein
MQAWALAFLCLAKLSSNIATSEGYCPASTSAGYYSYEAL